MSEKYIVTWDMLQIHARKLASRLYQNMNEVFGLGDY